MCLTLKHEKKPFGLQFKALSSKLSYLTFKRVRKIITLTFI